MSSDDATVEQQADIIADFLEGLVEAYGLDGEVSQEQIDDETIEVQIDGDDLGLLIGPKGQTLTAIQELSRTVVQRRASGTHHGRVRLDVSGYRQRRREALERFARSVADEVQRVGRPEGARADERRRPQGRPRHGQRDRRRVDGVRGRGSASPGRHPPGGLIRCRPIRDPDGPRASPSAPEGADEALVGSPGAVP